MATYTKSAQPATTVVHSAWCSAEHTKIQTALVAHNDYMYLSLYVASLGNSAVNTTIQHVVQVPEACTLVQVTGSAVAVAGTTKPTFDIFEEDAGTPATILTAAVTLTAAKTEYDGVLATGEGARVKGDLLGLRCTTAADGTATHVCITLVFKKTLTT